MIDIDILYKGYEDKFGNAARPALLRRIEGSVDNTTRYSGWYDLYIDSNKYNQSYYVCDSSDVPHTGVYILKPQLKYSKPDKEGKTELISNLTARPFDSGKSGDWFILFWEYIQMSRLGAQMSYALVAHALNTNLIRPEIVKQAINDKNFSNEDKKNILTTISNTAWSLSQTKISWVTRLLESYGLHSPIVFPADLIEAGKVVGVQNIENYNVSALSNAIINACESPEVTLDNTSPFVDFICQLNYTGEIPLDYYERFFPYLNEEYRAKAIRRYFYEIKQERVEFSESTPSIFLSQNFYYYSDYRYIFEKWPAERNVATEFLFDCLDTYKKTEQRNFQVFNGILDWAIQQSITRQSLVELNFRDWLLSCEGGVLLNRNFKGFAEFYIEWEFNEMNFEEESLKPSVERLLQNSSERRYYDIFEIKKNPETGEPILDPETNEVIKVRKRIYEDIWDVKKGWKPVADIFVNWNIEDNFEKKDDIISFSKKMIDYSIVHDKVLEYSQNKFGTDKPSLSYRDKNIIIPLFGSQVTMKAEMSENTTLGAYSAVMNVEVVRNNVKTKLQELFGETLSCDYDQARLFEAFQISLFNNDGRTNLNCFKSEILNINPYNYPRYCAPKLSEVENFLTGKKFCNCDRAVCFKTCVDKEPSWQNYKLVHLLEILGYNVLEKTDAGYIPIDTYNSFVWQINRAVRFYRRLKCRECGHILFPIIRGDGRQNLYTDFKCMNQLCSEYNKPIYLNYCFNCKSGIIDSRDTKRCPNGYYICPTCKSCCSNAMLDRIVQRYILNGRTIPARVAAIQGNGHGERNMYFCPKCGTQMLLRSDSAPDDHRNYFCPDCDRPNEEGMGPDVAPPPVEDDDQFQDYES